MRRRSRSRAIPRPAPVRTTWASCSIDSSPRCRRRKPPDLPHKSPGKTTMSFRVLFALLLWITAPLVQAERLPVETFFKDPEFTSVSLSPTGEYITVSVPQGDRTVLAAFKVDGMRLVGKWDYGAMRHIDRVSWVNDERFFLFVSK